MQKGREVAWNNQAHALAHGMSDHMEIVINTCYGGFGLSESAQDEYVRRTNRERDSWYDLPRDDPDLIQLVKDLGTCANGQFAKLTIVRIPGQYARFYSIKEYDGTEWVRIDYDKYKVHAAKSVLQDRALTQTERISRAVAVLGADLK